MAGSRFRAARGARHVTATWPRIRLTAAARSTSSWWARARPVRRHRSPPHGAARTHSRSRSSRSLSGVSTAVLDTFLRLLHAGHGIPKVVGGIADDVVGALRDLGPVVEWPNTFGAGTGVTYHPDHLKVVWERLVVEAGAGVLLHAFVQDVAVHDGRVEALIVATKSGSSGSWDAPSLTPPATRTCAISPGSATSSPASWNRPRR